MADDDLGDMFDSALHVEEQSWRAGYEEGLALGLDSAAAEADEEVRAAARTGLVAGIETGHVLGVVEGVVGAVRRELGEDTLSAEDVEGDVGKSEGEESAHRKRRARALKLCSELEDMLRQFPEHNDTDEDLHGRIGGMRGKLKVLLSLMGVAHVASTITPAVQRSVDAHEGMF